MSGGAWEYVMGVMVYSNGRLMSGRNSKNNSGFNGIFGCPTCDSDTSGLTELTTGLSFPEDKYYDQYQFAYNDKNYQRRILGDATGEMGPFSLATYGSQIRQISSWYSDEAWFAQNTDPWFRRGGGMYVGMEAGNSSFFKDNGRAHIYFSFRVVLSVSLD